MKAALSSQDPNAPIEASSAAACALAAFLPILPGAAQANGLCSPQHSPSIAAPAAPAALYTQTSVAGLIRVLVRLFWLHASACIVMDYFDLPAGAAPDDHDDGHSDSDSSTSALAAGKMYSFIHSFIPGPCR